ncbi:LPS export ABC transporter permease LptG [Jannaschia sp. LMIT008]|uniref:LPS export ABC transporter permease LptG n=1 Tax=Jannaschia maritima TaxID=3032585 RepID=UPI0028124BEB|nr:LPS export ABC transporter permease LptG [Jannaschia sp. LMIT008]
MTLSLYLARRFAFLTALVTLVFTGLMLPIDLAEQLRRFGDDGATLGDAARLAALNLPGALNQILPLIVILATLALFLSLARSSELVVVRAAGQSGLRAVSAPAAAALVLGIAGLAVVNPIVAATQATYEREAARFANDSTSVLSVDDEGVWLRQGDDDGQTVIQALRSSLAGTVLFDATFTSFAQDGTPVERIDASRAELRDGDWSLRSAKRWPLAASENPERDAETVPLLTIPSTLTEDQIRDSFGVPSAIPIFELPRFVARLEAAGFSALAHRMWLQMELASPLMLAAMVLIGAAFTMGHVRAGGTGPLVLLALVLGFGMFFLRDFAQVLGESGQIPVALAAWTPPLAAILLALGIILRLEDG